MKRKILSLLLVFALVIGAIPAMALNANLGNVAESLGVEAFASVPTRQVTVNFDKTNASEAGLFALDDVTFSNNLLPAAAYSGDVGTCTVAAEDGDYVLALYKVQSDAVDCLGTIVVTVGEGSTDFTAYAVTVNCQNSGWVYGTDFTVTASAVSGGGGVSCLRNITMGKDGSKPTFLCLHGDAIEATVIPSADKKSENFAKASGSNVVTGKNYAKANAKCTKECILNVEYPYADENYDGDNDYALEVGTLVRNFTFSYLTPSTVTEPSEGKVTATFKELSGGASYFYRVSNPINTDAVTYGNYIKLTADNNGGISATTAAVTVEQMYVGNDKNSGTVVENFANQYDVADIYLSVGGDLDGSITGYNGAAGWLNMDVSESVSLYPYRNWLPINTVTGNVPMQPDFHVNVINIEGNPINIRENVGNDTSKHSWNITANGEGTAILLITYDAVTYDGAAGGSTLFSAIWPKNTGVIVVTVGKQGGISTNMTINETLNTTDANKLAVEKYDAELDVLYYVGNEGATYSFKPEAGTDVTMAVCSYDANGAMTFGYFGKDGVTTGADGTVTLSGLKEGKTIVKLTKGDKVAYQILRAEHTDITVMNSAGKVYMDTSRGFVDSDMVFSPGETVILSFTELYHPVNKLSGIYNMYAAVYLTKEDGTQLAMGSKNQYTFASSPATHTVSFAIPNDATDDFGFNGCFNATFFGSKYGSHRMLTYEAGKSPNFTAGQQNGYMGRLPHISLPIDSNAEPPVVVDATFNIKSSSVAKSQKLFNQNDASMAIDLLGGRTTAKITEGNYILAQYDANNSLLGTIGIEVNENSKTFNTFVVTVNANDGWNCGTDYRVVASVSKDEVERNVGLGESGKTCLCLSGDTVKATVVPSKAKKQLGFETTSAAVTVSAVADANINITCPTREVITPSTPSTSENITVTFRLIGCEEAKEDVDLGKSDYIPNYVTWVSTTSYELPKDSTAYDLWTIATKDASIKSEGADNNYISSVWAPEKFGGYELSEFANGARSGWMYTINGSHPGYGVKEQELKNNDKVIFHYVNDYSYEVDDWFDDPLYPSLGDGTYYNGWLKAADRVGAAGGLGGGGGAAQEAASTAPTATASVETKATVTDGKATANVKVSDVTKAIETVTEQAKEQAKTETAAKATEKEVVLAIKAESNATAVEAKLPTEAVKELAKAEAKTVLQTECGNIEIPSESMSSIADQAAGKDISVTVETKKATEVVENIGAEKLQQETGLDEKTVNEAIVVEVKINVGETTITSFGGKSIKLSLPVAEKQEIGKTYKVIAISEDGSIEVMSGTCVIKDGKKFVDVSSSHLTTFVVTNEEVKNPFSDVHDSDYFYAPVLWAIEKNITAGTTADTFAPFESCTRAQMVTFLWRVAGKPWASANLHFSDVASDAYYAEAVEWAVAAGITKGIGETTFAPNDVVTREQLASFIYRYAVEKKAGYTEAPTTKLDFNDAESVHAWADEAMHWCVEKGIVTGMGDKMLAPQNQANRAQIVTMLYRFSSVL